MAMDAAMIQCMAHQLHKRACGARIDRITMPSKDEVVVQLRTRSEHMSLLLSVRSGSARIHLTQETFENPQTPPSFCMLLRKYIGSSRITGIRAALGERILFIEFESLNELGDLVPVTMSVELMGRYNNIVIYDRNSRIIDALRRIDFEQSAVRQLLPGLPFVMPPVQQKLPFINSDTDAIVKTVTGQAMPLSKAILSSVSGLGPVVCRQIAWMTRQDDADADHLDTPDIQALSENLEMVKEAIGGKGALYTMVLDGNTPVEYSFIPLTHYEGMRSEVYGDPNEMLDAFYSQRDREERMRVRSAGLARQVQSLIERTQRKNAARLEESDNSRKAEEKRLFGELLYASLHSLNKGMNCVEVENFYTGEMVVIPLDGSLTPVQNAQKYYKEYRKLTTAARILQSLIKEGEQELEWLVTVQYEISQARSEEDFLQIRRELHDEGFLRSFKIKPQKNKKKTSDIFRYRTHSGMLILSGRNNAANERLTLHTASKNDWWFHVKNAPGSHVVLLCESRQPEEKDLEQAAVIAAYHSSLSDSLHVEVDYTQLRNVKKPPEAKAGMVTYDNYRTAVVSADARLVESLVEKA